jgi:hypothetical protein
MAKQLFEVRDQRFGFRLGVVAFHDKSSSAAPY